MSWLGGWWSKKACKHCFVFLELLQPRHLCLRNMFPRRQRTTSTPITRNPSQDHYAHSPTFGRFVMIVSDHFSPWRCHFSRLFSGLSKPSRKFTATQEPCQVGFSWPLNAPTSRSFLGDKLWSGTQDTGHETVWSSSRTARGTCGKLPMTMPSLFLSGTMTKYPHTLRPFKSHWQSSLMNQNVTYPMWATKNY